MGKRDGAGTLIIVQDRMLLLQRSYVSTHGGFWAPPGGRIDKGETPFDAAIRETKEEAGIDVSPYYHTDIFRQPLTDETGTYTTYVFNLPIQSTDFFNVKIDHESIGWGWFTVNDMRLLPLHPGVHNLLEYIGLE